MSNSLMVDFMSDVSQTPRQDIDTKPAEPDQSFQDIFNVAREQDISPDEETSDNSVEPDKSKDDEHKTEKTEVAEPAPFPVYRPAEQQQAPTQTDKTDQPREDGKTEIVEKHETKLTPEIGNKASLDPAVAKALELILNRLGKLAESDPSAFKKLMEKLPNLSMRELTQALGITKAQVEALATIIDPDAKLSGKFGAEAIEKMSSKIMEIIAHHKQAEKVVGPHQNHLAPHAKANKNGGDKNAPGKITTRETSSDKPVDEKASLKKMIHKALDAGKPVNSTNQEPPPEATKSNPDHVQRKGTDKATVELVNIIKDMVKASEVPKEIKSVLPHVNELNSNANPTMKGPASGVEKPEARLNVREAFEKHLVEQVIKKVRFNVRTNGISNMTMQLDPPSLGKVNMRVIAHDNIIRAVFMVETQEARMAMENNIESLRTSMNAQGLRVDQIIVTTPDTHAQYKFFGSSKEFGSGDNQQNGSGNTNAQGNGDESDGTNELHEPGTRASVHDGALDIVA